MSEHGLLGTWTAFESIRDTIPPEGDTTAYEAQMLGLREMLE